MLQRISLPSLTAFMPIANNIITSIGPIVVTTIVNPMEVVTRWEESISHFRIPSAQPVDTRGTNTCPSCRLDYFFRVKRGYKQIHNILGITQHHQLQLLQLSKQLKKGRSAMPGSLPTCYGTLNRLHYQHLKLDQVTIPLLQLPPDPKTDQQIEYC